MKNKKLMGICMIFLLIASMLPVVADTDEDINDYSAKVAGLIDDKCHGDCKNVLILGDDAVVPHYRREISMYSGMWWWKNLDVETIFTDQLYAQTGEIYFAEMNKLFNKKQDVTFVISASLKDDLHSKVEELKTVIMNTFAADVIIVDESEVACNSFSLLDDATLIIIGDEINNAAVRCMPFLTKETSFMSIERNVWDNEYYAIVLNPTEDVYDNLLALINIIKNGPKPTWTFKDTVIACLWDGKFGGAVPTAQEITCNMIPLVELAPDIRDSWDCKKYLVPWYVFNDQKDDIVEVFICEVVHFATGYDLATWIAAIFTAGTAGAAGEIFDGGIAILKVSLKEALPNIAKAVGKKMIKDALDTILLAPHLLKGVVKLIMMSPKLISQMIEGSIHILKHGPEVAQACFDFIKNLNNFDWSLDTLKGLGSFKKAEMIDGLPVKLSDDQPLIRKTLLIFSDEGVSESLKTAKNGMGEIKDSKYLEKIEFVNNIDGGESWGQYVPHWLNNGKGKIQIALKVEGSDVTSELVKKAIFFHEYSHAKIIEKHGRYMSSFENTDLRDVAITFDELLTDKQVIKSLDNAVEYKSTIRNMDRFGFPDDSALQALANQNSYSDLFQIKAQAIFAGDTRVINKISEIIPTHLLSKFDEMNPSSLMGGFLKKTDMANKQTSEMVDGLSDIFEEVTALG